jgi:TRAP-type C4-dicarboxylate transport system substrate-binding protein
MNTERTRHGGTRLAPRLARAACVAGLLALLLVPGSPGDPAGTALAQERPQRWRFAIYDPTLESILGRIWTGFAKSVAERTGGRLTIEVYPAGALGYSGFTHHQVVGDGLIEMGEAINAGALDIKPFAVFAHMMLFEDEVQAGKAWDASKDLLEQAAARINAKPVAAMPRPPDFLNTTKRPFDKLETFRGARLRSWNAIMSDWLKRVGAEPVAIPYAERYTALSQGIVEGNYASPVTQLDTKDYEVTRYTNLWPGPVAIFITFVNVSKLNALPADVQKILLEEVAKAEAAGRKQLYGSLEPSLKQLADKGVTIVRPSPAELAKGRQFADQVMADWRKSAGDLGNQVLDRVLKTLARK